MFKLEKHIETIKKGWIKRSIAEQFVNCPVIPKMYLDKIGNNFLILQMILDSVN